MPQPKKNGSLRSFGTYLEGSEVDHAVNVWMRLEDFVEVLLFSDVDVKEFGSLSADELDTIDGFF